MIQKMKKIMTSACKTTSVCIYLAQNIISVFVVFPLSFSFYYYIIKVHVLLLLRNLYFVIPPFITKTTTSVQHLDSDGSNVTDLISDGIGRY